MTIYTIFNPPPNNSFGFQPTLDGSICTATVWWNLDGQRWFLTVATPTGAALFTLPLLGSPSLISLQSLTWANGFAVGRTAVPHGYRLLDTIALTLSACLPVEYNGTFPCFITGDSTFRYPLDVNPNGIDVGDGSDEALQLGFVGYDINMGAGYLLQSSIVFREPSRSFEVNP